MIVIGIDSASRTGFAAVKRDGAREELLEHGVVDGTDALAIERFAECVTGRHRIDAVAIEDNYLGAEGKGNPVTMKALARMVGRWQQAFEVRGVETCLVLPQVWQSAVLKGFMHARSDRATRKKAAKIWARGMFHVSATEDECDAIVLATFEARRRVFAAQVKKAS